MRFCGFFGTSILLSCLATTCYGDVSFATLEKTLRVEAFANAGKELQAGEDELTVKWSLIKGFDDSSYKIIKLKLCYAPISQKDRSWRRTDDNLKKDKTCQFEIIEVPYKGSNNKYTWMVAQDVPTATYFIRAYAYNSEGHEIGYGQNTYELDDDEKLYRVTAISGRNRILDICSLSFSVFCVVALFGFFFFENRPCKKPPT